MYKGPRIPRCDSHTTDSTRKQQHTASANGDGGSSIDERKR